MTFEYKVVPAPKKGKRGKGLRSGEDKFANALMEVMNLHGAEGWEYLRLDTLPVETRSGLRQKGTEFQNMMIFQRVIEAAATEETPVITPAIAPVEVKKIAETHAPLLPPASDSQVIINQFQDEIPAATKAEDIAAQ